MPAAPRQGVRLPPQTHRFRLTSQAPNGAFRGGRFWLVDAHRFPISKTVTGAVFEIDPGAMRELHWHPNADEWQYMLSGRASVTMFGSGGRFRTETLAQGDVGYIPQGYGHSIENVGDTPMRILIGFNSGDYQEIGLSQWMAAVQPLRVRGVTRGKSHDLVRPGPYQRSAIRSSSSMTACNCNTRFVSA